MKNNIQRFFSFRKNAKRYIFIFDLTFHRSTALANAAEKKQKGWDKAVDEWKRRVNDLQADLDRSQSDNRAGSAEVYKLKAQIDELNEGMDALKRDNKSLTGGV